MKNGIKELPGNVHDLAERAEAAKCANNIKVNNGFVYLFLIAALACFHNLCAASGNGSELLAVKDSPVNVAPVHDQVKTSGDRGVIAGKDAAHGGGSGFFDLLLEEFKPAPPDQASPGQVNNGKDKNSELAELNANIDKLCHILLAYFIPAVMFFISVPLLIFYWARGSLKSERHMRELMKYNWSKCENQAGSAGRQSGKQES